MIYTDVQFLSDRAKATEYYLGQPFGDEEKGHPQTVLTDVRDVTLSLAPGLYANPTVAQPCTIADLSFLKCAIGSRVGRFFGPTAENGGYCRICRAIVFPHDGLREGGYIYCSPECATEGGEWDAW